MIGALSNLQASNTIIISILIAATINVWKIHILSKFYSRENNSSLSSLMYEGAPRGVCVGLWVCPASSGRVKKSCGDIHGTGCILLENYCLNSDWLMVLYCHWTVGNKKGLFDTCEVTARMHPHFTEWYTCYCHFLLNWLSFLEFSAEWAEWWFPSTPAQNL